MRQFASFEYVIHKAAQVECVPPFLKFADVNLSEVISDVLGVSLP